MKWELHVRPPANVCPEGYCFHWAGAGDLTSPPGRKYKDIRAALADSSTWKVWTEGGCACSFGQCSRLKGEPGELDFYEPHEPRLKRDGLPRFYFNTLNSLRSEFHDEFIRDAVAIWGETALVELADPPFLSIQAPEENRDKESE